MEILAEIGDEEIAKVYIGKTSKGNIVEFVESTPTYNPYEKWVLIVSTLNGCPVGCMMCDAGTFYHGRLSYEEIMGQINHAIHKKFPDGNVESKKFKIQFARMGEPTFNPAVLDVIVDLGKRYENFFPSLSTVAPIGVDSFFNKLIEIKKRMYPDRFQLQFSIHTTNETMRDKLIPIKKWSFKKIAEYGSKFYDDGGLKITLNFALAKENEVSAKVISRYFPEDRFLIKITPINPTGIGDTRENEIGSNCGMYVLRYVKEKEPLNNSYTMVPETLHI